MFSECFRFTATLHSSSVQYFQHISYASSMLEVLHIACICLNSRKKTRILCLLSSPSIFFFQKGMLLKASVNICFYGSTNNLSVYKGMHVFIAWLSGTRTYNLKGCRLGSTGPKVFVGENVTLSLLLGSVKIWLSSHGKSTMQQERQIQ